MSQREQDPVSSQPISGMGWEGRIENSLFDSEWVWEFWEEPGPGLVWHLEEEAAQITSPRTQQNFSSRSWHWPSRPKGQLELVTVALVAPGTEIKTEKPGKKRLPGWSQREPSWWQLGSSPLLWAKAKCIFLQSCNWRGKAGSNLRVEVILKMTEFWIDWS